MERPELVESPRKRQRTDDTPATGGVADAPSQSNVVAQDAQAVKELDVGITELVTADSQGFFGILKKRSARALRFTRDCAKGPTQVH